MIRLRYAWSSLHVLPYLFAAGGMAFLIATTWTPRSLWLLLALAYFVVLAVQRVMTAEFLLGDHWMRVPGPHAWHEAVIPAGNWGSSPRDEPRYSEGRLVRLADVGAWKSRPDGVELRMRDGSVRSIPFHGLRPRDARLFVDYLESKLGDRRDTSA